MRGSTSPILRPAVITALAALRDHRTAARLLALLAGAGVAFLVPLLGLFAPFGSGTSLRVLSVPAFAFDLGWTGAAVTPAVTQQLAVRQLFELLILSGFLTFCVVACSILLVAASIASERAAEHAVRRSVGASSRTLLLAAFVEAGMLAAIAVGGGGIVAVWLSREAVASWPGTAAATGMGPTPALLAAALALLIAALLPLVHRGRRRLTGSLREPPGLLLPSVQLGLALAVLTTSAIISNAAQRLGRSGSDLAIGGVGLSVDAAPASSARRSENYEQVITALDSLAGVTAVSLTSPGQLVGLGVVDFLRTDCGVCSRGGILLPWLELNATVQMVSSDTFHARGFGILAGRGFEPRDRTGSEPVAVVNRHLAGRYFEDGDAVGRDLFVGADWKRARHRVIGIVDDERSIAFGGRGQPLETVYLSVLQHPATAVDILLTGESGLSAGSAAAVVTSRLGGSVRTITPAELLERQAAPGRWFARWFGIQGWAMLAAAVLGIFAFMRRWVFALAPEIALRRAGGATRRRMALLIAARASGVGLAGALTGLVFFGPSLWTAVARLVPGASAWEPATVARFAMLLAAATLAGAALPAWRVLRLPPARFLSTD